MQYEKLVPSRELCEEMQRLNICQDEPELWFYEQVGGLVCDRDCAKEWIIRDDNTKGFGRYVIAPTLSRMMEEMPRDADVYKGNVSSWFVGIEHEQEYERSSWEIIGEDEHLPNALAKSLIALKKG